jgi:mono/diheme cytochrome c family protein
MKRLLKWIGIIAGGLIAIIILAAVVMSFIGSSRLNKTVDITAENITIPTDADSLARGEHLVDVGCRDCHTAELTGQPLIDDPAIGTLYAANITGLATTHTDEEIVRAIRHGVDTDGRQLMIMPSDAFIHFSEEDLGALIAYLKTVPQSGEQRPKPEFSFMARVLFTAGMFGDPFPAEYIDHDMAFAEMPEIGANVAYGEYLAHFCTTCHGAELAGAPPPDPDSPPAPNLTPAGDLGGWTQEDFLNTIRTGVTPTGRELSEAMPWGSFAKFDDEELVGLWMYLQTLPPVETAAQ